MSSAGALVTPPSGEIGHKDLHRLLMQTIGRDLGLSDWGSPISHTSYASNSTYAHTIQNQGTGGHLNVPGVLQVQTSGVTASVLAVTGAATVGGTLGVTGAATFNGNVTLGDASGDTVTVNGTPTFNAASTFKHNVTIQNSALTTLASFVVTAGAQTATLGAAAAPGLYVDVANGRTLVGTATALTSATDDKFAVVGGTAYFAGNSGPSLGLRYSASDTTGWAIGLAATGSGQNLHLATTTTNGASLVGVAPAGTGTTAGYIGYNNATPASASLAATVRAVATAMQIRADSPTGSYLPISIITNNTVNATFATTGVFSAAAVVAGSATGTLSGTEELRVVGQTRLEGDVTVSTGTVTVSAGNIDVQGGTAGEVRSGKVIVGAASLSGTEELRVAGQTRLEGDTAVTTGALTVPTTDPPTANTEVTAGSQCKAWAYVTVSGGTITINDSYNVDTANCTYNAAGDYSIVWDRNFSSANYAVVVTPLDNGGVLLAPKVNGQIAGSADVWIYNVAGTKTDPDAFAVAAFGTLT